MMDMALMQHLTVRLPLPLQLTNAVRMSTLRSIGPSRTPIAAAMLCPNRRP